MVAVDAEMKARILYMEDDEGLARLVQKRLKRQGYQVVIATNGVMGLKLLAKEVFNVAIIDFGMPHKNGLEVLRTLNAEGNMLPTIMLSAQDSLAVAVEAMKLGASDYLIKQADASYLDLLPRILSRLLEKQQLLLDLEKNQRLLNQKTQILQTTLANISQGLCVFDNDSRLLTWNQHFIELVKYPLSYATAGTPLQTFFDHDNANKHPSPLENWVGETPKLQSLEKAYCSEWPLSDGRILEINANPLPEGGFVITYTDKTKSKQREKVIEYQATHDKLTDLPNRQLLSDRLNQSITQATLQQTKIVVALIDLDNFKYINDSFGHSAGDRLLKVVASRLQKTIRDSDTVARFGGDEFVIILTNQHEEGVTLRLVRRILDNVAQPIFIEGQEHQTSCSLGISTFPDDGKDPDTLLKMADIAMYRAKNEGRNTFQFYTQELQHQLAAKLDKETKLRKAISAKEFRLHYQPKVDLTTGKIVSAEALIRWHQADLGEVPPDEFIPFAEETGLIIEIDRWVFNQVCLQVKSWQADGIPVPPIAINISAETFEQKNLDDYIGDILSQYGVQESQIVLEITETASMRNIEKNIETMQQLKKRGFNLSIDDFGSGYSNLNYLRKFPVNSIKIDRCFVSGLPENPMDLAIIKAVITMGHSLGMRIIAEGVETEAQMKLLAAHQCDEMQGFYFSKPIPCHDFAQMLVSDITVAPEKLCRRNHEHILLVVDDEPNMLSALKRSLRQSGYQILFANSASEAFDLMAKNEIGVVLSDHNMPVMSGVEMLSRTKLLYPETTRILMSGFDDSKMAVNAINRGEVFKFATKPLDMEELKELIDEGFLRYEKYYD